MLKPQVAVLDLAPDVLLLVASVPSRKIEADLQRIEAVPGVVDEGPKRVVDLITPARIGRDAEKVPREGVDIHILQHRVILNDVPLRRSSPTRPPVPPCHTIPIVCVEASNRGARAHPEWESRQED